MSKAEKIRQALAGGKKLTLPEIREHAPGLKSSYLTAMTKRGELIAEGEGHKHTYRLNPDYTPDAPPRTHPRPAKRKKRIKGHMAMKRARKAVRSGKTLADIAARLREPSARDLALDNYIGASALLRTALRDQVDGLDDNPMLVAALAQHERAEKLVRAA
jgi:hypothetical protein